MSCSARGFDNPEEARFCKHWAAPLARACASCGISLPPEAWFCLGCGQAVAEAPARATSPSPAAPPGR